MLTITCSLDQCPSGLFLFDGTLCFKSEYRRANGSVEAYVVDSGEAFWGGTRSADACDALQVIPVYLADTSVLRFSPIRDEEE